LRQQINPSSYRSWAGGGGLCYKHVAPNAALALQHQLSNKARFELHQPLIHHGIGNLKETSDVGAVNIIARRPVLFGGAMANRMDAFHDFVEPRIYFLPGP